MRWLNRNMKRVVMEPMGIHLYFTTSRDVMKEARQKLDIDGEPLPHFGICTAVSDDSGAFLILVGVYDGGVSTFTYELSHAVFMAFERAGMNGDYDQLCMQEHFCYQLGRLCGMLEKTLREGVEK